MDAHDKLDFVLKLHVDLQALQLALPHLNFEVKLHQTIEVLLQLIAIVSAADPLIITRRFEVEERLELV